jgi:hypothetical protein
MKEHRSMEDRDFRAEIIEKFSRIVVDNDLGEFAKLYLNLFKPVSTLGGVLLYYPGFVFFEVLGPHAHEIGQMLIDNPQGNIDRILTRIEELETEKEKRKTEIPNEIDTKESKTSSFFNWIKRAVHKR